jgi:hypothetical protein
MGTVPGSCRKNISDVPNGRNPPVNLIRSSKLAKGGGVHRVSTPNGASLSVTLTTQQEIGATCHLSPMSFAWPFAERAHVG